MKLLNFGPNKIKFAMKRAMTNPNSHWEMTTGEFHVAIEKQILDT